MPLDLNLVREIVTRSQKEIADIHLNPKRYVSNEVILKEGGKDYTTQVDILVERKQKSFLREVFPEIGFLGEETDSVAGSQYVWIVDPTDGTAVFSTGGEYYSNSVALADKVNQKILFGSVYQPPTGRQFVFEKGNVSVTEPIVNLDNLPEIIHRRPSPSQSKGLPELIGCAFIPSKYRERYFEIDRKLTKLFEGVNFPELKRSYNLINAKPASGSSALFCCDIADGKRHFALLYLQKAWDLAGGAIYAGNTPGCIVEILDNGGDLVNKRSLDEQIASCTKESLISVGVFANLYVRNLVMDRFNSI